LTDCWILFLCVFSFCCASVSQAFHSADKAEAQAELFIFSELCVMKDDAGPCKAMKERFFFDIDAGRCRPFEYGGCGGNANNFQNLEACEATCVVSADKSPCHLGEAPGPCRGLVTRYFFNRVHRECQQFYYGGCFGNANNFRSLAECRAKCQNPVKTTKAPVTEVHDPEPTNASDIHPPGKNGFVAPSFCRLSSVEGPCQALERRFSFSALTQKCGMFHYGGCGGNQNNFANRRQCMRVCMNLRHAKSKMIRIRKKNMNIVLREA
ncbi:hypothetical protein NHX12_006668, partial [Muraenolepis orangiensis]